MPKSDYKEITTVLDPQDKIVTIPVTVREMPDGEKKFSFAIFREFKRPDEVVAPENRFTPWFGKRHIAGIRRALDAVEEVLENEAEKARLASKPRTKR